MNIHLLIAFAILPVTGYLLGAIPFGLIISQLKGKDIRRHGSGNIGATNVGRVLGKTWGYLCFALDLAKGLGPVLIAGYYLRQHFLTPDDNILSISGQIAWLITAAACIVGHVFPVYLKFKGGKGVATSLGVVLGIWPWLTLTGLLAFAVWILIWAIWRYVSLASICAATAFPAGLTYLTFIINSWYFSQLIPMYVFSVALSLLVIVRHRSNIIRLLKGTENRGSKNAR